MFLAMALSIYTSRVVLDVLGVENYGIYSVVAGVIVLLTILNNTMVNATQRFLTFEIGSGDREKVSQTFSMSLTAHVAIALLLLLIGETVGLWYVCNYLSVPEGREEAAQWVYQLSLLTMVVSIIRSPYNAAIISYEKMSFFAVVSIVEMVLKLVIVFLLVAIPFDKLIVYAFLIWIVSILVSFIYWLYCKRQFDTCTYHYYMDSSYFKKMMSYLGWSFFGGISTLGTQQVGNLMINSFWGVAANAAYGVANQVNSALSSFVTNFQTAFRPQVVKLYAQGNSVEFHKLMNRAALLSYYLLFLIAFPIFVNIDFVLSLWLKVVPDNSGVFCNILIITAAIDALQAPLWMGISATGEIKKYQIWSSVIYLLNIPFAYICLKLGMAPYWVLLVRLLIGVVGSIYRTILSRNQIQLSLRAYFWQVLLRASVVTACVFGIEVMMKRYINLNSLWDFLMIYIILGVVSCAVIYVIGVNKSDRRLINNLVLERCRKFTNK